MRIGIAGVGRIGAFHAATLADLPGVDSVVVADVDPARMHGVAARLGMDTANSFDGLLAAGIDALVVATSTATHPQLIIGGVTAGIPVFCEKPVAAEVAGTMEVVKETAGATVPVQVGFQRRFDAGYRAAREAVTSGFLGWVHTLRATTLDSSPPSESYVVESGGILRDCAVHDFDAVRWVSGHEVVEAYAVGANRGEAYFRAAGDVDTVSCLLTLDDGTLAVVSATRYNGAGYDVRLEVLGSEDSISVGLDSRMPLRSAEPAAGFQAGAAHRGFMSRFADAYRAELAGFVDLVAGKGANPCTLVDALEAFLVAEACELSRQRREPVRISEVRP